MSVCPLYGRHTIALTKHLIKYVVITFLISMLDKRLIATSARCFGCFFSSVHRLFCSLHRRPQWRPNSTAMRLSADIISQAEQRSNPLGEREIVLRGLAIPSIEHLGATRDLFDTIDFADNRISRLENFPRLLRLSSLFLSGNSIESIDAKNLKKNVPNITNLVLTDNRIEGLHEIGNIAEGCAKLEFLTLTGNPVTSEFLILNGALAFGYSIRFFNVLRLYCLGTTR